MKLEELQAYEVISVTELKDIKSIGYLCRHKRTGAKVALIMNDDDNKVFSITFRTPPKDSTGVAHITEHSVLCGSKNFPLKDPFVELCKGSLNTYLNAMTFPDKTMYPVASCNATDFQNLMHVYLDAVFYPNIYINENIFLQEGWHYEIDPESGELFINGVVYNEMKGAFSSADDVLNREIVNSLYPHTEYGVESGGDPKVIPELTYEAFLDFHKKHYHPSNAYIFLYGDMDMAEKLDFIDREYLSHFDALEVDSSIATEPEFVETNRIVREIPMSEDGDVEENSYISLNLSVGDYSDQDLYIAFDIIDYALCTAPGAPVKQALVDKGLGDEVYSIYDSGIRDHYFSFVSKGISLDKEQEFLDTIRGTLQEIVDKGFDRDSLMAGINYYEFRYREADYGRTPKGLMYNLIGMESWLYDDDQPFLHINANDTYGRLRSMIDSGYFEGLLRKYFLENTHRSIVILKPVAGLAESEDAAFKEKMATVLKGMGQEELDYIAKIKDDLREYRERQDSREVIETIPLLKVEDLDTEPKPFINELRSIGDTRLLYHDIYTNGIGYLRLVFKINNMPQEYIKYLGLFKGVFALMNTTRHKYFELTNEVLLISGGVTGVTNVYVDVRDVDKYNLTFEVKCKALYENLPKTLELIKEIILESDFSDVKRLKEILAEGKSDIQSQMMGAGHNVAVGRASSYLDKVGQLQEVIGGLELYKLTCELEEDFDNRKDELIEKLITINKIIFREENLMVDYIGEESSLEVLKAPIDDLKRSLFTEEVPKGSFEAQPVKLNEGLCTPGSVQYVCRSGNFIKKGLEYTGSLKVLKVIMGYEYLWTNIRVKGGAYGCMCGFGRTGESYFVSYRDPNLLDTIDVYEKAAEYVEGYDSDERTMTQYIIGTIGELDTPQPPSTRGLRGLVAYMSNIDYEVLRRERHEMLHTTPEDIRALGKYIRALMSDGALCVVGSSTKIKENREIFGKVENLF